MNWLRLHVSNLCNFKCPNCHVFELGENNLPNRVMSEEVFNLSVDQFLETMLFLKHQSVMISIYGGETLANKKVIKQGILKYGSRFKNLEISWVVNTNGSLLSEEDVVFFKDHNVEIHISVDGVEDIHNLSRPTHKGKGTFHLVIPALKMIRESKLNAQINSYMMPSNFSHLRGIVDIAEEYGIKKIYLDQFYNLDMISHEIGMQKYRDAYFYALSKGITISGPWAKVIDRYHRFSPRELEMENRIAMDVNIDGTYYFPANIESKKVLRHIQGFQNFVKSKEYEKIIKQGIENYRLQCQQCKIKEHCFGTAIEQVHYHIGPEASTKVSCDFFRDWISFLNRPVYFKKFDKVDVVSLIPLDELQEMIQMIEAGVKELESKFWILEEKIILHVVEYPEELRGSSGQYNLPDWAKATTRDKNHFYQQGTSLSKGYMHELMHFFIAQKNLNLPKWFIEGICEWVRSPEVDGDFLRQSINKHNILDHILKNDSNLLVLIDLDQDNLEKNGAYYQVKALVCDFINLYGWTKLLELLSLSQRGAFDENFLKVTDKGLNVYIRDFLVRNSQNQ